MSSERGARDADHCRGPRPAAALICQPGLEPVVAAAGDLLGWVEIEPQVSWLPERGIASVLESGPVVSAREAGLPLLLHSVGAPVGGTLPPPPSHTAMLAELVTELGCPWVSEHLSILRIPMSGTTVSTGVLLAPPQSSAAVALASENLLRLSDALDAPVAFETGVNYLRPRPGELADGEFFAAVAEAADCGILLDLHNLWCNQRNGRDAALDVLAALPLDRVWEVHVAAGYQRGEHYLDAHSDITDHGVLELLDHVLPLLTNVRAITFEVSPDRVGREGLTEESIVEHLGELAARASRVPAEARPKVEARKSAPLRRHASMTDRDDVQRWEQALGALVLSREIESAVAEELRGDPGHAVWRDIAVASRRGQFAGVLPMTCRLLLVALGRERTVELLDFFCDAVPPADTSAEEMAHLADHLRPLESEIDVLRDVLDYELARNRLAVDPHTDQEIALRYDPEIVFAALSRGELPDTRPSPRVLTISGRPRPEGGR